MKTRFRDHHRVTENTEIRKSKFEWYTRPPILNKSIAKSSAVGDCADDTDGISRGAHGGHGKKLNFGQLR